MSKLSTSKGHLNSNYKTSPKLSQFVQEDSSRGDEKYKMIIESHSGEMKHIENIASMKKVLDEIIKEMEEIKRKELERIEHEFLVNDYEKRFNVGQLVLISAIIGKDNASMEYTSQLRNKAVLK